ncbi:hypothetical protein EJB05_20262, partial [Eragrostis curvula]
MAVPPPHPQRAKAAGVLPPPCNRRGGSLHPIPGVSRWRLKSLLRFRRDSMVPSLPQRSRHSLTPVTRKKQLLVFSCRASMKLQEIPSPAAMTSADAIRPPTGHPQGFMVAINL